MNGTFGRSAIACASLWAWSIFGLNPLPATAEGMGDSEFQEDVFMMSEKPEYVEIDPPYLTLDVMGEDAPLGTHRNTTCDPVFTRYPVAGPHNNGYDANWNHWGCGRANSGSDFFPGHYGNDIFAAKNTPVVAAQSGTISLNFWNSSGGNVVYIVDDCGWWHYYAHLDSREPSLNIGDYVAAGTLLGELGNTGATNTAPHLHYSVYPGTYTDGIDPHPSLFGVENTACKSGNFCSCLNGINVDWNRVPVTDTDCGHRVCGITNELWNCTGRQRWEKVRGPGSCDGSCSCPGGLFKDGRPIPDSMKHCGYRVCGTNSRMWDCTSTGWENTGIYCN